MQTFMPYPTYAASAKCLDRQRLGKQRIEARQILSVLTSDKPNVGWRNHPAVNMWRGYEYQLALYGACICGEWIMRGYMDQQQLVFIEALRTLPYCSAPPWMGNADFHKSHKSNLIRKAPEVYQSLWPDVPSNLPYVWPAEEPEFTLGNIAPAA